MTTRLPRYVRPQVASYDHEQIRDLLGPVSCQYMVTTVMLPAVGADSGSVVRIPPVPNLPVPFVVTVGDGLKIPPIIGPDTLSQGYLSFDISGIPSTAVVVSADLDLTPLPAQVIGNPFLDLGPLVIAEYDYGALDATDFGVLGIPIGTQAAFPVSQSVIAPIQGRISAASPTFKVTLYFSTPTTTDGNNDLDQVVMAPTDALLTVSYQ